MPDGLDAVAPAARRIYPAKRRTILPKPVIASLAAMAVATGALMPTGASAVRGGPVQGIWNWPPYAGSGGGMPGKTMCSYVRANPNGRKSGRDHGVYQCHYIRLSVEA
jgi:hypothetical protein